MTALELLVRASIWISVACWAWSVSAMLRGRATDATRWVWGAGADFFIIHAIAAFAHFYDWSHTVAVRETAAQTLEATGVDTGTGLWLNYLFGLVWCCDAAFWWIIGTPRYVGRGRWIHGLVHGFMAFMILQGTVFFGHGAVVYFGALIFLALAVLLALQRANR